MWSFDRQAGLLRNKLCISIKSKIEFRTKRFNDFRVIGSDVESFTFRACGDRKVRCTRPCEQPIGESQCELF